MRVQRNKAFHCTLMGKTNYRGFSASNCSQSNEPKEIGSGKICEFNSCGKSGGDVCVCVGFVVISLFYFVIIVTLYGGCFLFQH